MFLAFIPTSDGWGNHKFSHWEALSPIEDGKRVSFITSLETPFIFIVSHKRETPFLFTVPHKRSKLSRCSIGCSIRSLKKFEFCTILMRIDLISFFSTKRMTDSGPCLISDWFVKGFSPSWLSMRVDWLSTNSIFDAFPFRSSFSCVFFF